MIYNYRTIYYMEFLITYAEYLNQLYEFLYSYDGKMCGFYFTKNSTNDCVYPYIRHKEQVDFYK